MNAAEPRDLLRPVVGSMKDDVTDTEIPEICARNGGKAPNGLTTHSKPPISSN
jgi:hypothetical protein